MIKRFLFIVVYIAWLPLALLIIIGLCVFILVGGFFYWVLVGGNLANKEWVEEFPELLMEAPHEWFNYD